MKLLEGFKNYISLRAWSLADDLEKLQVLAHK